MATGFSGLGFRLGAWIRDRSQRKKLLKSPRLPLSELSEDTLGRIVGTVRPHGPVLESPLSKRICVYYAVEIRLWARGTGLSVVHDEQQAVPFELVDGDETAIVDTQSAKISSDFDRAIRIPWKDLDYKDHRLLETWKLRVPAQGAGYFFREAAIEVDDRICIYGAGVRELDSRIVPEHGDATTYRDGGKTRLHLTGSSRFPLVISDDPRVLK